MIWITLCTNWHLNEKTKGNFKNPSIKYELFRKSVQLLTWECQGCSENLGTFREGFEMEVLTLI